MNKKIKSIIAAVILAVANAAVTFLGSLAVLCLFGVLLGYVWIGGVLIAAAHITGLYFIGKLYLKKEFLKNRAVIWCLSSVVSLVLSGIGFIAVLLLDSNGYFTGFFAGLGEFILTLCWLVYSAVITVGNGVSCALLKKK